MVGSRTLGTGSGGGTVVSKGNVAITAVLAGLAVVLSAITYFANKRRTNDSHLPSHVPLRGRRSTEDRHSLFGVGSNSNNNNNNNNNNIDGGNSSTNRGGSADRHAGDAGGGAAKAGLKSYYAIRAERHVGQHSANALEWKDDVLGVRMLFSPILFAVEMEKRQAPLLLVTLRCLRQPEHRVAVIIEACATPATAEEYRDGSLSRIRECVKLLSCSTTRIGVTSYPSAEYCYMDAGNNLQYALSIFLSHGRLAVTAQYVADTRVKGVLPTAFNELVRSIQFTPPRPTSSYLLCTEPRLGLGFRLPLDFTMDEQLREMLTASDESFSVKSSTVGNGSFGNYNNNSSNASNQHGFDKSPPLELTPNARNMRLIPGSNMESANAGGGLSTLFAAIAGRGSRRVIVVTSYEPLPRGRASWQLLFERFLRSALTRFSIAQPATEEEGTGIGNNNNNNNNNNSVGGGENWGGRGTIPINVVWCAEGQELPRDGKDRRSTFIVRPQQLVVPINGDAAVDDDTGDTLLLEGAFCVHEITLNPNGASFATMCDLLQLHQQQQRDDDEEKGPEGSHRKERNKKRNKTPFLAHLGVFCLRIRDECVSITFLSSATRHTLEEFVTFCRRTLDTMSVGNHFGQRTSLIYCNTRHEVLPFHIFLDHPAAVAEATSVLVEEPIIGDPLAIIHVIGFDHIKVMLRVFPCPCAGFTFLPSQRKMTTRLEKVLQDYLRQLPDRVCVHHWETTMLGSRAALEIHYEQMVEDNDSDADLATLDEEIGHINPFAHYWSTTTYPALETGSEGYSSIPPVTSTNTTTAAAASSTTTTAGPAALHSSCSVDPLLMHTPSHDSREELASMRVAVAVCCEGCAFLFLAASTDYSLNTVRQVVHQLASNISVVSGAAT